MSFPKTTPIKLFLLVSFLFCFFSIGQAQEIENDSFKVVEVLPVYPGGGEAMVKYINDNFRYPKVDRENGITGIVIVKFTIDTTGQVINEEVIRSGTPTMDAEALRLVRGLERFTPGTQNGKKVKVYYTLPITFNFDDGQNLEIENVDLAKMVESGWGLDFLFLAGRFSGNIQNHLKHPFGWGAGVSFFRKRKMVDFRINYLFTKVKERFSYENLFWEKDRRGNIIGLDINGGYKIVRNKKLDITPFVGLSIVGFLPWKPVELQPVKSLYSISGNAGFLFDFKRNYTNFSNGDFHHELIRVKIWFSPILFREDYTGSHFNIGIGYGLNSFKNK